MQLMRVVEAIDLINPPQVSCRRIMAISRVRNAPAAAASIGVKMPKKMAPITMKNRISVSNSPTKDVNFSWGPEVPGRDFSARVRK
jgi:hypothetical protein